MNRWCVALLVWIPVIASAELQDELEKFFEKAGANVNVTSGEVYEGQKAGYMTGGGITVRGRVMNSQPLSVSLPGFDAGCGGIDIFNGGFTFINHDQLVETLKSIGSSAMGYAFLLGLETVSPQVSSVIKNLQSWSNSINAININSCDEAQALVGSVWPKRTVATQEICKRAASERGLLTNYVKGRHDCAQKDKLRGIDKKNSKNEGFLRDEVNIAWESIQRQSYLAKNKELAEFFMSLMGTIIFYKNHDEDKTFCLRKPSKIYEDSFLQALIEGGKTTIYRCRGDLTHSIDQCLLLEDKTIDFSSSQSWLGRIRDQLLAIQEKIIEDHELSTDEKTLLAKSSLPLYKVVNVLTAYKKGACPVDLYRISEIVAMDLLMQFLREAVEVVREGVRQFKNEKMYGGNEIDDYLEDLRHVERKVQYYETHSMQLFERECLLIQKIQLIEEQLKMELSLY